MAGNCIIEVTPDYLSALIGVVQNCHQKNAEAYRKAILTGFSCCDTCDVSLEGLKCLSSIIFYLQTFDIVEDNCANVHLAKQQAMRICKFNETDITDGLFLNALLLEDGSPIITEDGANFIRLEEDL